MGSNEPVRKECEMIYEIFHVILLNCGCEIKLAMFLAVKNAFYAIVSPAGCSCTCVAKGVD